MRLSSTQHYQQHINKEDLEILSTSVIRMMKINNSLLIKPTKDLDILAQGWIIKGFLRLSSFNYLY